MNKHCIQLASTEKNMPTEEQFQTWISKALEALDEEGNITIRIVDECESQHLNFNYRRKDCPTNVLSFPLKDEADNLLGDIVICAPVVLKEAKEQNKLWENHFAHLTIHGVLHVLGYNHSKNDDAVKMESTEIDLLNQLGYENPYQSEQIK